MFRLRCLLVMVCITATSATLAQEGWASRDHDFASRHMSDFVTRFERDLVDPVSRSVRRRSRPEPSAQPTSQAATVVPSRRPRAPEAMAEAHPAGERAQARRMYEQYLTGYRQIEQQFDIAPYDVAGAVAAFIAGSYMGYHNTGFPDRQFKPLVQQMRRILSTDPSWAAVPVATKQDMYEQLAILGMLVANSQMALARKPDSQAVASMTSAAKRYIEQFLKVDADRVEITDRGLSLR